MDKIRSGWRSQHWRSPKIEESQQPDRVKLVLPMVSLIPPKVNQELSARFGPRFDELGKTARHAVVAARVEGSVTNGRLQEVTGEHPKDITPVLQALVRDGLLTQQNQRRWASYRVAGDSPQSPGDCPHSAANSSHSTGDSPHSTEGDSPQSPGDSPHFPPELLALAEPARRRTKLPAADMREVIAALCAERWLTSRELDLLLQLDPDNLQTRFLTAMVCEKRLELRFPDILNRPDQAYRTPAAPG